jgi:hypothetical protein
MRHCAYFSVNHLMVMLSYYKCIKTLSPVNQRNAVNGSGNESRLRSPIYFKNSWRVTVYPASG